MTVEKLNRREVVKKLISNRDNLLIISGLGSPTYDLHDAGDNNQNFYLWGAMGGAAMMGLGLALSQPEKSVLVVTGDGEQLMGIGALATISVQMPKNLTIAVLDNEHFGETGMQKSHTGYGVDLVGIAHSSGFPISQELTNMSDIEVARDDILLNNGPMFLNIKINSQSPDRSLPTLDGVELKNRFRTSLKSQ